MPERRDSASARPSVRGDANTEAAEVDPIPEWFSQFLNDRQTRKPSAHTMKAYRQDFIAIARLVTDGDPARLGVADITKDSMRTAFAGSSQKCGLPIGWTSPIERFTSPVGRSRISTPREMSR